MQLLAIYVMLCYTKTSETISFEKSICTANCKMTVFLIHVSFKFSQLLSQIAGIEGHLNSLIVSYGRVKSLPFPGNQWYPVWTTDGHLILTKDQRLSGTWCIIADNNKPITKCIFCYHPPYIKTTKMASS